MSTEMPSFTQILVIGGGPGGAYAACALAREGFQVTLCERENFPRYHIGESMLPSCRHFLRFIGAEDLVSDYGFTPKPGAAVKLNQHKREGYTDFIALNPKHGAWNVVRSEFDNLLLRYAAKCGAEIHEGISIVELEFDKQSRDTPVSAVWKSRDGNKGSIKFDWLVDASGRAGLMSTKYLKNRQFTAALKNIAYWGYWRGASSYSPDTDRANAPWFEALTDESGWAWFIPLHNGTVSVGVVMTEELNRLKKSQESTPSDQPTTAHYLKQLQLAPGLLKLLDKAELSSDIKSAADYSYSASQYSGPQYRIVGDAGAFIDPFFSSGVHLAFTGALSAAISIAASIRSHCSEREAIAFHNIKVGVSYTRFLLVVLGVYKQIRSQASPVMSDINEDNFDRAFHILRPIIQGTGDVDPILTEREVQDTMDFCKNIFAPTQPSMHVEVSRRLHPQLINPKSPILDEQTITGLAGSDVEARHVLLEINARKAIHGMYDCYTDFETEVLDALSAKMERGSLGLVRVA